MRIVISWSGDKSRKVAQELRKWLPLMFETVDVWVSSEDIGAGKRWSSGLASVLDETDFGIICLTKENLTAPWILFETGAIAKSVADGRAVPYLIDLEPEELAGPLSSFQAAKAGKRGSRKLVGSAKKQSGSRFAVVFVPSRWTMASFR